MSMPEQNKGESRQDYETPQDLICAITGRFGGITFDLAASAANHKAMLRPYSPSEMVWPPFYTKEDDSLSKDWTKLGGLLWLNPEFKNITPYARKCRDSTRERHRFSRILLLTPASIGSDWFLKYVHREALVLALNPRITFLGEEDPYPKDAMLSCYGENPGFDTWRWR